MLFVTLFLSSCSYKFSRRNFMKTLLYMALIFSTFFSSRICNLPQVQYMSVSVCDTNVAGVVCPCTGLGMNVQNLATLAAMTGGSTTGLQALTQPGITLPSSLLALAVPYLMPPPLVFHFIFSLVLTNVAERVSLHRIYSIHDPSESAILCTLMGIINPCSHQE